MVTPSQSVRPHLNMVLSFYECKQHPSGMGNVPRDTHDQVLLIFLSVPLTSHRRVVISPLMSNNHVIQLPGTIDKTTFDMELSVDAFTIQTASIRVDPPYIV